MVDDDEVLRALDALLEALDEMVDEVARIRARADRLRGARRQGRPYSDIVDGEDRPLIVEMLSDALETVQRAGARFRREEARALHDEGLSMERIASHFGVTRQRVSALLRAARG